ncbi:MAG: glycosyltransferase family 39 protein [Elusimicrobiales bacterium]|nr:glycosyltransferase family 39 protein [Elusimicrobiales bacterium]
MIFAFALALRLFFLYQWSNTPYYANPHVDAWVHKDWALAILSGRFLRERAFYQSPFYPYFLAGVYKVFGVKDSMMFLLQAAASAFTCLLIARITARVFDEKAGFFAGLLAAVYKPFIFQAALLLKETWVILGMSLLCLSALRAGDSANRRDSFLCGLATGFTALSRGNALLLVPLVPLFWFWENRDWRATMRRLCPAFALGIILPILPATLHNYMASRDFVPINYTDGFVFYMGNNPRLAGSTDYPPGISSAPLEEEAQTAQIAELEAGHKLKPSEVSAFWFRKGLLEIANHPADWFALNWRKLRFFWNWFEPPDEYAADFIARNFGTVLSWPILGYGLACTLGLLGMFAFAGGNRKGIFLCLCAAAYALSVLVTFISDRYRLPMVVFLLPFAGALLARLTEREFHANLRGFAVRASLALPLVSLCWLPPLQNRKNIEAQAWSQLVSMYFVDGKYEKSVAALENAFKANPARVYPQAILDGAASCERLRLPRRALLFYNEGIARYPSNPDFHSNKGALLFELGDKSNAVAELKRAIAIAPGFAPAYKNLSIIYALSGDKSRTRATR